MPTIRVISATPEYNQLGGAARRSIAEALRLATADVLFESVNGIEAFWWPPFDPESALNTLQFSVDIEFSSEVPHQELERLADALLLVFQGSAFIEAGLSYGVWIKTPYEYLWKESIKH